MNGTKPHAKGIRERIVDSWGAYLDGDGGVRAGVGLVHDRVVGEHHDVGLDLLGDALGPRRRQLEPHGLRRR